MTKELLQKLLQDNGIEINEDVKIDEIFNGIDASIKEVKISVEKKTTSKFENGKYAKSLIDKHYKENGFNNQDDFKAKLKSSNANTSEMEELVARLKQENKEKEENINSLNPFKEKANNLEKEKALLSKGISIDDIEYVNFQISKNVSDEIDYETASNTYLENDGSKFITSSNDGAGFISKTTPPPITGKVDDIAVLMGLKEEDIL